MKAFLTFVAVSLAQLARNAESHVFMDELVGELTPMDNFPPFLKSIVQQEDLIFYPNNRQFRHLPGYREFRKNISVHTQLSLQLQRRLAEYLKNGYERMPPTLPPDGTRVEDQKYEFRAMMYVVEFPFLMFSFCIICRVNGDGCISVYKIWIRQGNFQNTRSLSVLLI